MNNLQEQLGEFYSRQIDTDSLYRPLFFRLSTAADEAGLAKILQIPGLKVFDQISGQIRELIKFRNPDRKLKKEELEILLTGHLNGIALHRYGVWIYYPWSGRLVHSLDEEEFIAVRTSRNQYKITPQERAILQTKKIGVVGLSVGQSVSVTLAMERVCGEIRLADFDALELTNLNRIRTGIHNLGLLKVYSVAREIAEIDPFLKVVCYPDGLTEKNMTAFFSDGGRLDLLVEESDGFDIKILSRFRARELGIPVIMEASDRCMVDVERFDLEPERPILHGIVRNLNVEVLKSLKTNEEKIPYMLDVLGIESTSPRLKASMLEMHQTINTWPQLASAVTMGGGITADVSRRLLLNQFRGSGRFYVDIEELICDRKETPSPAAQGLGEDPFSPAQLRKLSEKNKKPSVVLKEEQLQLVMQAAALAPSYGNFQSWRWAYCDSQLFLCPVERPVAADPENVGLWVSLGCVVENVSLTARRFSYEVETEILAGESSGPVILVRFKPAGTEDAGAAGLEKLIPARHTNRASARKGALAANALAELRQSVTGFSDVTLSLVTDATKIEQVAAIAGLCERLRLLDPEMHREFFDKELRMAEGGSAAGNALGALHLAPEMETAYRIVSDPRVARLLSAWDAGSIFEKAAAAKIAGSPGIGLISVSGASMSGMLTAGRAAERLWLTAVKNNLSLHPICLPLYFLKGLGNNKYTNYSDKNISELKEANEQLSLIFSGVNTGEAVFLFRVFEADEPGTPAVKRTLQELFLKC